MDHHQNLNEEFYNELICPIAFILFRLFYFVPDQLLISYILLSIKLTPYYALITYYQLIRHNLNDLIPFNEPFDPEFSEQEKNDMILVVIWTVCLRIDTSISSYPFIPFVPEILFEFFLRYFVIVSCLIIVHICWGHI